MYTVKVGDQEIPVQDLPTLQAMLRTGQIQEDFLVYDHAAGSWRTVGEVLAPPAAAPVPPAAPPPGTPQPSAATPSGYQKTTPGKAIWSFILSLAGLFFCMLLGIVGLVLGYQARRQIDDNPQQFQGRGFATAGIILGWIQVVLLPVAILALIAVPNFVNLRTKAYDASARSAGRNTKLAEEVYYNDREGDTGYYTTDLNLLLQVDRNLTDDQSVTFNFLHASEKGFTLYTTHESGSGKTFMYTD